MSTTGHRPHHPLLSEHPLIVSIGGYRGGLSSSNSPTMVSVFFGYVQLGCVSVSALQKMQPEVHREQSGRPEWQEYELGHVDAPLVDVAVEHGHLPAKLVERRPPRQAISIPL